jgi:hypothetical protein
MQEPKRKLTIDLVHGAQSSLAAHHALSVVDASHCYHLDRALRHPLGIYNISVSRVCEKLTAFCSKLEKHINQSHGIDGSKENDETQRELIDYIELAIYAAAEHVDDLEAIAFGFFKDKKAFGNDASARRLMAEIKTLKAFVSASANSIKHQQARIRLYALEFNHAGIASILHGYFIEGVDNGTVGPSVVFHKTQKVFSITTLAWEILLFLLRCSESLQTFLATTAKFIHSHEAQTSGMVSKAVISAARLPLFTFDEAHPFARTTFILTSDEFIDKELNSGLYGSLSRPWSMSGEGRIGNFSTGFVGDGVTKSFSFPSPKKVSLQHWQ